MRFFTLNHKRDLILLKNVIPSFLIKKNLFGLILTQNYVISAQFLNINPITAIAIAKHPMIDKCKIYIRDINQHNLVITKPPHPNPNPLTNLTIKYPNVQETQL